MFDRYTEQARRALFFARFEVSQLGGTAIEPEHILLGLLRERKGLVARMFEQRGVSAAALSVEVVDRHEHGERISTSIEIPFSSGTRLVLEYAADEADRLGHSYIGTEHLLLGVLREERSMGAELLVQHGLGLDEVRKAVVELLRQPEPAPGDSTAPEQAERILLIKEWLQQLTLLASDGAKARQLQHQIETNLAVLISQFPR